MATMIASVILGVGPAEILAPRSACAGDVVFGTAPTVGHGRQRSPTLAPRARLKSANGAAPNNGSPNQNSGGFETSVDRHLEPPQLQSDVQPASYDTYELEEPAWVEGEYVESGGEGMDSSCAGCDGCGMCGDACCDTGCAPCAAGDGWLLDGWLAQGYTWNPQQPVNRFNLPVTFNDRANEYQMNQLYLRFGRSVVPNAGQLQLGGQVDLLYGTDYFFTTSRGLETDENGSPTWNSEDGPRGDGAALYGLAMPQLYADVFVPIGDGVTVRMGHFYTTMGYETVTSPHNFFYSHSYAKQYAEPFTHTGVVAFVPMSPQLRMHGGFTQGWNNWEDVNNQLGFLGGFDFTRSDGRSSLALTIHAGREDDLGENDRFAYSLVYQHHLSGCVTYVFQHDFGTEQGAELQRNGLDTARWYGINQYLMVNMTPTSSVGLRVEWFRDQDNARVLAIPIDDQVQGGNYSALSLGLNLRPTTDLVIRPELRWDWSDVKAPGLDIGGPFDDFSQTNQALLATDVIWTF